MKMISEGVRESVKIGKVFYFIGQYHGEKLTFHPVTNYVLTVVLILPSLFLWG